MANIELSQREKEILKLVVSGYIETNQPVSSLFLTERYPIGLSSATVRSIFSDLEHKGYLFSPHRSSGRLPTEMAYRIYVDSLSVDRHINDDERTLIQKEYLKRDFQINQILDVTCRILSMLTRQVGVVLGPEPEQNVLKHIELIDMGQDEILVVLVTRSGTVYSRTLFLENRIPGDYLHRISRYLNDLFKGSDLRDLKVKLESMIEQGSDIFQYFPMIARTISAHFDTVKGEDKLYTSGIDNLLAQFSGSNHRIKELGSLFDSGEIIQDIFKKTIDLDDVAITIEGDRDSRLSGISIITASYKMGEKRIGTIGIVGPNRMNYHHVISIVEYIRFIMSNMITKISS